MWLLIDSAVQNGDTESSGDDEDDDTKISEIRFVPADATTCKHAFAKNFLLSVWIN